MPNLPTVSVVVPCRNRAHFLRPTIDSILEQNYPYVECIVIDAASQDGTVELLKSYGDRIDWVSEPDAGHANAINKGWGMSHGSILAWLNADDVYARPDAVSIAVDYLQAHPATDLVYGSCGSIDAEGRIIGMSYSHEWDLLYAVEHCDHCIPQPAAFIRRSILERVGWLDETQYQKKDHELWLRIGMVGRIDSMPDLLAHARDHEGNLGYQGDTTADSCVQLTRKFFARPDLPPEFRGRYRHSISNAYLTGMAYAWDGGRHLGKTLSFLLHAIAVYPPNFLRVLRRVLSVVVSDALSIQRPCVPPPLPQAKSCAVARRQGD
ncbi:MAG: glycosyltransferase [Acidobacteriia bacterium]|nr:glycosyltransferase [Terriglobia bacterium]